MIEGKRGCFSGFLLRFPVLTSRFRRFAAVITCELLLITVEQKIDIKNIEGM